MGIKDDVEAVFQILSMIYVHDTDVEHMAQAKQMLRAIYAKLDNEGSGNSG